MSEGAGLDKNDQALVKHFLRGMRRFVKHVRAENPTEAWGRMFGRVEIAHQRAKAQFQRELQQKAAGERND
jgi:hypothetical protein